MKARCLLVVLAAVAACDTSGNRTASTFTEPDPLSLQIAGRVRAGLAVVEGAVVRVAATPGGLDGTTWTGGGDAAIDTTTVAGLYQFVNAPHEYDIGIRSGRDAVAFRELLQRYVEPSFGDDAIPPSFSAKVALEVDPPPAAGHELAFFVSGQDAVSVSGDLATGVAVAIRQFSLTSNQPSPTTLHVVEHAVGDLGAATAYGRVDLVVSAAQVAPAVVHMAPITAKATPNTVTVKAPAGATASDVEIGMHFGIRTAAQHVATIPSGTTIAVVPAPNAIYTMRATATRSGAAFDSALQPFYPWDPSSVITMPEAPVPEGFTNGVLFADSTGVREHTLLAADGSRVRAVTTARAVALADLANVGVVTPPGTYSWTVKHWPTLPRVENFAGPDVRAGVPSATSAPVTVTVP